MSKASGYDYDAVDNPNKLGQREAPAIYDTPSCVCAAATRAIFMCLFTLKKIFFLIGSKKKERKENDKASLGLVKQRLLFT